MSYAFHTELELARTREPAWRRRAVWDGLDALRRDGVMGAPVDTVRDNTGEEQDSLWLEVGRWMEALAKTHGSPAELSPAQEARWRQAFVGLRASKPQRWPVAAELEPYLLPLAGSQAPAAPQLAGTGGEPPEPPGSVREARARIGKARVQGIMAGLREREAKRQAAIEAAREAAQKAADSHSSTHEGSP